MSLKTASKQLASTKTFAGSLTGGGGGGVTITSINITDNSWNNLDDTAIGTTGGYIKINGTGFVTNPKVFVNSTEITSGNITFISSSLLRVVVPSLSLGTYNIFVFNTDNSGAILTPGLVVSGTPDFTQTVYTSGTPASVSIQLLAVGDAPLTYELQAGSSLPAGCSLSSSGLITGTTVDGVYQFTVIVSDAQLQSFQHQITLTIASSDPNFKSTVLAINADTDTFVRDASSNSFAVTINGDTRPSAFSPYNTNWSIELLDASTSQVNFTTSVGSNFSFPGDFTIESWVNIPSGGDRSIYVISDNTNYLAFNYSFSASTFNIYLNSGSPTISPAHSMTAGWHHVALVRSGSSAGNIKVYVDGIALATTATNTSTLGYTNPVFNRIGGGASGTPQYVSNLRICKSAVYTGNFTPATSKFTTSSQGATNCILLTAQDNRFLDIASSFVATLSGTPKINTFGPFTETDITTGSGYFDGTGDYLTVASNSAFTLGSSGDFTIECWVYLTASPSNYAPLLTTWSNASNSYVNRWAITYYNNRLIWYTDAGNIGVTDSVAPTLNEWTHVAAVRSGSTITFYKNGVSLGTQTTAQAYTTDGAVSIGFVAGGATITGYITSARIVKGTAVYTSNFTPPTSALTAVANTSLLTLQTRQPVNNHTFVDRSGINNLITRAGNASQGSFSPYSPAGWSNYFDGTGDFLSITGSSATNFNGVDWTFECWFYKTALSGGNDSIIQSTTGTNNWIPYFSLGLNNNLTIAANLNAVAYNSSQTYSLNTWNHIAMVRSGGVVKVYLNGTATSISVTSDITSSSLNFWIGKTDNAPGGGTYLYYFNGYLSNLRIVKGTALYTSNFTPPTSALTAVANTSLLICQSNRFIDNSTNNFTLTRTGDVRVANFSPFAPTASYSPAFHGGSVYFDGTGDYLYVVDNSAFDSLGDFTIEAWVYFTSVTGTQVIIDKGWSNGSYGSYLLTLIGGPVNFYSSSNGSTWDIASAATVISTPVVNTWYHIAITRSGTSFKTFVNGAVVTNTTTNSNLTTNNASLLAIGADSAGTNPFIGYISDVRIIKGTAVYTSAFTPPTAPVTPVANTSLLLNFTNAGIIDATSRNVLETVGDAKIVTNLKKYGNGSMYFDGTGDYLLSPSFQTQNFVYGTGDFTIEGWIYLTSTGTFRHFYDQRPTSTDGAYPTLRINESNAMEYVANSTARITSGILSQSTWYHFALARSGTSTKLFIDGTQSGSTYTDSTNYICGANRPFVGASGFHVTSLYFQGYIDDLRITKGFARYTANFTPPTSTFLTQ